MSNFPLDFDDDTTLPVVNDNITEIGAEAINSLRDAVFNIEQYLGINSASISGSISSLLNVSLLPNGAINPSALTSLGLVTLPITGEQISNTAQISETKLNLDYHTQDLYNYIKDLSKDVRYSLGWISSTGIKLEPHITGAVYRHTLHAIGVSEDPLQYFENKFRNLRDNSNAYLALNEMNDELLAHQFADGSPAVPPTLIITNNGSSYPATHAHVASGIYLNTSRFERIPQTNDDVQKLAEHLDQDSALLIGTRIQTLYSNGIPRTSRASILNKDGYGQEIIGPTNATTYLLNTGLQSSPFDDIDSGDDVIELHPPSSEITNHIFDGKFALVKIGDSIIVNYGGVEVKHVVREKKYMHNGGDKKFYIRIESKNLKYTTSASVRIDKPLFNINKYGSLSLSAVNNTFGQKPSLIIGSPKGASALGLGFNADLLDSSHYMLYLQLYPTGNPSEAAYILPGIDVTGNQGKTPGFYTLQSVIEETNKYFRKPGYNYRFVAFEYDGEFGIALADSYKNASFSICSVKLDESGLPSDTDTASTFPNNVIGFPDPLYPLHDPLGFGSSGANIASPPYAASYAAAEAALVPTKIFVPLKRQYYYVDGKERDLFKIEEGQAKDLYGDGYWVGTIHDINKVYSSPGRVEVTYKIPLNLSNTSLEIGKTIVVQLLSSQNLIDCGRFIIKNIVLDCLDDHTYITVYDAVHGTASSPQDTLALGNQVAIYFNSDSVSFNKENLSDFSEVTPFKRNFEVYIDSKGKTFTNERARMLAYVEDSESFEVNGTTISGDSTLSKVNIVKVSPKLKGKQYGIAKSVSKITLVCTITNDNYFKAYLCDYDGSNFKNAGAEVTGKIGQVTRVYNGTNVDYIDILFNPSDINLLSTLTDIFVDIQLFPSLAFDDEFMQVGSFLYNDSTKKIGFVKDDRQFGNTSEKNLTTSALNYISAGERILHANGIIRGFDLKNAETEGYLNPYKNNIYLTGGLAQVNGKFIQMNDETVSIPLINERYNGSSYSVVWAICVSDSGEFVTIPILDKTTNGSLSTPNNPKRLFKAKNPLNGQNYYLDALTFSEIINNRKDLVMLHLVMAKVTVDMPNANIEYVNITDVRRYVNDIDNNLYLKLTSSTSQGNFRNVESIFNWIKYNNEYNGTAIVRGATVSLSDSSYVGSGAVNIPIDFSFDSKVTIDGQNNGSLTFNEPVTFEKNITFNGVDLHFASGVSFNPSPANIEFYDCNITIDCDSLTNVIADINSGNNIIFKNCNITSNFDGTTGGALFRLNNTTEFIVDRCNIVTNFNYDIENYLPGDVIQAKNSPITITNSNISGNFSQCIRMLKCSNVLLEKLNITTIFNPTLHTGFNNQPSIVTDPLGLADGLESYLYNSTTNLVNSGRAVIYTKVDDLIYNISINECTFTYNPELPSSDRLPTINFDLYTNASFISNLKISNCLFNSTNLSTQKDDILAAIAFINKAPTTPSIVKPSLKNVIIQNNQSNRNQSICITSKLYNNEMYNIGLAAENCIIQNNVFGSIGYWVCENNKIATNFDAQNQLSCPCPEDDDIFNSNSIIFNDKSSNLIIENNNCHLIHTIDETGREFLPASPALSAGFDLEDYSGFSREFLNRCNYYSGNVTIANNKANWIHVGISGEAQSNLQIINNNLLGYNEKYLLPFKYDTDFLISNSIGYAIFVSSNSNLTTETSRSDAVKIIENTTGSGIWYLNGVEKVYNYSCGILLSQGSGIISQNILEGCNGISDVSILYYIMIACGKESIITNNNLSRRQVDINGYFATVLLNKNHGNDTINKGIFVDNSLDTPYINSSNSENVIDIFKLLSPNQKSNVFWNCERNKNQTGYATIPLTTGYYPFGYNYLNDGYEYFEGATLSYKSNTAQSISPDTNTPIIWSDIISSDTRGDTGLTLVETGFFPYTKFKNESGTTQTYTVTGYISWELPFGEDPELSHSSRSIFVSKNDSAIISNDYSSTIASFEDIAVNKFAFTIVLEDGYYFSILCSHNDQDSQNLNNASINPGSMITILRQGGHEESGGQHQFISKDKFITNAPGFRNQYKSYTSWFHDNKIDSTLSTKYFGWQESLEKYLPNNVFILGAKIGVKKMSGTLTSGSLISMHLNRYDTPTNYLDLDNFTALPSGSTPYSTSIADTHIQWDHPYQNTTAYQNDPKAIITGGEINSSSSTKILSIDLQNVPQYSNDFESNFIYKSRTSLVNNPVSFGVSLEFRYKRIFSDSELPPPPAPPSLDLYISPIQIKYRW